MSETTEGLSDNDTLINACALAVNSHMHSHTMHTHTHTSPYIRMQFKALPIVVGRRGCAVKVILHSLVVGMQ